MKISGVKMGHYTNLMEENEGPDPEIPSSPPQPFTNPEPSKPPMVYFSNSSIKMAEEKSIFIFITLQILATTSL